MQLLPFKTKATKSHSAWVDVQHVHVRNLFLFCFGLSVAKQLFMQNILCQTMNQSIDAFYVNTQCFMNGTFTPGDVTLYHDYYQWVSIYLLVVAFSFTLPFACWSRWNQSYLNEISTAIKDIDTATRVFHIILESEGNALFWKTWMLELFYAVFLLVQVGLTDVFFHHAWSRSNGSWRAISTLFPETGTCHIDYYSGGDITLGRFRCLLPLNSVYAKIFRVLYGFIWMLWIGHIVVFAYRGMLTVRKGKRAVNVWWALTIAKDSAETWITKRYFDDRLKNENWKRGGPAAAFELSVV